MNRTMGQPTAAVLLVAAFLLVTFLAGCHHKEQPAQPASTIAVETQSDGIHLRTSQAEFVITSSGALVGRLKSGAQWLTLDEILSNSGSLVTSNELPVKDFVADIAHAQVLPANG